MSSQKLGIIFIFILSVVGCSLTDPYIDRRRNLGTQDHERLYLGPSKPETPVICYNGLVTDDDELQELATEECKKQQTGNYAEFEKKTYFDGKLLLPNHAHYKCIYKKDN